MTKISLDNIVNKILEETSSDKSIRPNKYLTKSINLGPTKQVKIRNK